MYNHSCSFNEINETNVSMYTADSIVPLRPHPYSVDFHVQFKREPFPHELVMNADSCISDVLVQCLSIDVCQAV